MMNGDEQPASLAPPGPCRNRACSGVLF